jgi:NAD(P)-dependent dehydrogenase (short-subunit alcohol dehydrogenase family)
MYLTSRTPDALRALAAELDRGAAGGESGTPKVEWGAADLRTPDAARDVVARARAALGGIDILVNNAGVFMARPFSECSLDDYDAVFDVNVRAPFLLAREVVPEMAERGWGRIVNIGSSSSYAGFAGSGIYCASKHALLGLSRALHDEYKERGVRTFCISPGSIKTAMGEKVPRQTYDTFIEPSEIAEYVAFVIGFDSTMVSEEVRLNRMRMG